MALDDRIKNTAEQLGGRAEEVVGSATHDDRLEAEGRADQTKAKVRRTGEDVKDLFR